MTYRIAKLTQTDAIRVGGFLYGPKSKPAIIDLYVAFFEAGLIKPEGNMGGRQSIEDYAKSWYDHVDRTNDWTPKRNSKTSK